MKSRQKFRPDGQLTTLIKKTKSLIGLNENGKGQGRSSQIPACKAEVLGIMHVLVGDIAVSRRQIFINFFENFDRKNICFQRSIIFAFQRSVSIYQFAIILISFSFFSSTLTADLIFDLATNIASLK